MTIKHNNGNESLVSKVKEMAERAVGKPQAKRRTTKKAPDAQAFEDNQLSLFKSFLCNTDAERSALSNTIHLWDSVPRYSLSQKAMNRLRGAAGNLKLLKIDFQYRGKPLRVVIQPAKIEIPSESGELVEMDFYPSAQEELVEDALRKIAADQQGYFDRESYTSGVVFSLHMLREELRRRGHTRSFQQVILSLQILAKSNIEIIDPDDSSGGFGISNYLPSLAGVTRKDLEKNPNQKWVVQFHPLVTESIDQLTYRQYNYQQMMGHSAQLARWLHKQLALKFTFAAIGVSFDMHFSTIERDSAMLTSYNEIRLAVKAVDVAIAELQPKVLMTVEKKILRGDRDKILDVVYTMTPSVEFIKAMKASNKRVKIQDESRMKASK